MKKNLNAWKRTISSIAAFAVVMSLGGPFTAAYGVEYPKTPPTSQGETQQETGNVSAAEWEKSAVEAIGTASGRDAVEKIYDYLRTQTNKNAASFNTLAKKYNLACNIVNGTFSGAAHSWNVVQLDKAWYAVDVEKGVLLAGSKTVVSGENSFSDLYLTDDNTVALSETNPVDRKSVV